MSKDKTMKQPRDLRGTLAVCVTFPFLFFLLGMLGAAWCVSKIEFFAQNSWQVINILKASAGLLYINFSNSAEHYQLLYNRFPVPYNYAAHFCIGSGAMLAFAGLWLGWWITTPQRAIEHLAGRQLKSGKKAIRALKKEMLGETGKQEPGVEIFPGIPISQKRETKNFLAVGGAGAGKTTVIYPIIKKAEARGDRLIIYDCKGEWTQRFQGIILAPWDKRCAGWKISADLENVADARTFSENLVKESSDPMWSNASRAILTATLLYLINEKDRWNLQTVLLEIAKGYEHVRDLVRKYTPASSVIVESEEVSKTEKGFLITLGSYLSTVSDLAEAWEGRPEISLRRWLLTNKTLKPKLRTIILQGNERYKQLSRSYIQAVMQVIGATVSSAEMQESRTRKIWFCFDEIAQVGNIPTLTRMLETGRSKGVRMILGAQDLAQVKKEYGPEVAEIWTSNINTYFLGRTGSVETAEYFSKMIGKQKLRKYVASYAGGGMAGSTAEQRQDSWQESDEWVVRPDEFGEGEIGEFEELRGVKLYLLTGGKTVYKLLWPYVNAEKIREGEIRAAWTRRKVKQLTDYGQEFKKQSTAGGVEQKQEAPAPAHEPEQQQGQQDKQKPEQKEPKPEPKQEPKPEPKSNSFLPPQPTEASEAEHDAAQQEPEQEQEDVHKEIVSEGLEDLIPGWNEIDEAVKGVEFASSLVSSPKKQATQVVEMSHDEEEEQEC
jgi:hypothetical protein